MQSLIVIIAAIMCVYAVIWIKNYGYSFIASLRVFVKRLARCIMSLSCALVVATILMIACYSNLTGILKDILSANAIENLKSFARIIFGVDSAFAALQMLAFYSLMASFVSCLVLSLGVIVQFVYRAILKVTRSTFVEENESYEELNQHFLPTFKLYLKYNS